MEEENDILPEENKENRYRTALLEARQAEKEQSALDESEESSGASPQQERKISNVQAGFLLTAALITDGLQVLFDAFVITAPLSWIVWIFATIGFFLCLHMLGLSWSDAKGSRMMTMLGGATGLEFIPFLNALPAWTAFAVGTIIIDRSENIVGQALNTSPSK